MGIGLSRWVPRFTARASLDRAREALRQSIALEAPERRGASRMPVRAYRRQGRQLNRAVLNLSSTGMAVQVPSECRFGTGEIHHFALTVGTDTIDVEGRVCWTESSWRRLPGREESVYTQIAGIDLLDSLVGRTQETWQILISMVGEQSVTIRLKSFQVVRQYS